MKYCRCYLSHRTRYNRPPLKFRTKWGCRIRDHSVRVCADACHPHPVYLLPSPHLHPRLDTLNPIRLSALENALSKRPENTRNKTKSAIVFFFLRLGENLWWKLKIIYTVWHENQKKQVMLQNILIIFDLQLRKGSKFESRTGRWIIKILHLLTVLKEKRSFRGF